MAKSASAKLRPFEHNPRQITSKRDAELDASMQELGDTSSIVHDWGTGEAVDGNQRSRHLGIIGKTYEEMKASGQILVAKEFDKPDKQGTVALGWIQTPKGWFAYRGVRWDKKRRQKANIKGNMQAGTFDADILANDWADFDLVGCGFDKDFLADLKHEMGIVTNIIQSEEPETVDAENQTIPEQYAIMITCKTEQEQASMLERFLEEGLSCRALIS